MGVTTGLEKCLSPSFWVVYVFNWYVFVLVYVCHCICNWYVIVLILVIVFVIVIIIIRPKHSLEDGGANWGDFEQLSWAASPNSLSCIFQYFLIISSVFSVFFSIFSGGWTSQLKRLQQLSWAASLTSQLFVIFVYLCIF